jgi:hypothetical protein
MTQRVKDRKELLCLILTKTFALHLVSGKKRISTCLDTFPRRYHNAKSSTSLSSICSRAALNTMGESEIKLQYVDVCLFRYFNHFLLLGVLLQKANNYIQIGINLGDPVFRGSYHGRKVHDDDLSDVILRARDIGCTKFMVTGSDLKESKHAIRLAGEYRMFYKCIHNSFPLFQNR